MFYVTEIPNLFHTKIVPKINQSQRRKVSAGFYLLSKVYHPHIPIDYIEEVLNRIGYHMIQEDGEAFEAIFCGEEGSCFIQIANEEGNVPACLVCLQWYKQSTRYEINVYLS